MTIQGTGVSADDNIATIYSSVACLLAGSLIDGQIRVDFQDEEKVVLVLNGTNLHTSSSAPVYVLNAEKVVLTLADGTTTTVSDSESYILVDGSVEPNAAIFRKDDLNITGGSITITAAHDAIKGKDSTGIIDTILDITFTKYGIQSGNDTDKTKGNISIENSQITITSGLDGIQAKDRFTDHRVYDS